MPVAHQEVENVASGGEGITRGEEPAMQVMVNDGQQPDQWNIDANWGQKWAQGERRLPAADQWDLDEVRQLRRSRRQQTRQSPIIPKSPIIIKYWVIIIISLCTINITVLTIINNILLILYICIYLFIFIHYLYLYIYIYNIIILYNNINNILFTTYITCNLSNNKRTYVILYIIFIYNI